MISSNEVFKLVYLEAMAQGCIVIASKGGGFDGIIVDGQNGFLCDPGDSDQLESIYRRINTLPKEEKEAISAIKTAVSHTDSNAARRYLDRVLSAGKYTRYSISRYEWETLELNRSGKTLTLD